MKTEIKTWKIENIQAKQYWLWDDKYECMYEVGKRVWRKWYSGTSAKWICCHYLLEQQHLNRTINKIFENCKCIIKVYNIHLFSSTSEFVNEDISKVSIFQSCVLCTIRGWLRKVLFHFLAIHFDVALILTISLLSISAVREYQSVSVMRGFGETVQTAGLTDTQPPK